MIEGSDQVSTDMSETRNLTPEARNLPKFLDILVSYYTVGYGMGMEVSNKFSNCTNGKEALF